MKIVFKKSDDRVFIHLDSVLASHLDYSQLRPTKLTDKRLQNE